jgi:hypothetical protein
MSSVAVLVESAVGTLVAEVVTMPVCTTKTVFQVRDHPTIRSAVQSIHQGPRGWKGFYAASFAGVLAQVVSTSSKFTFYRMFQPPTHAHWSYRRQFAMNACSGALAGVTGSFLAHPFDVWKVHRQLQQDLVLQVRQQGPRVLYRGFQQGLAKNTMGGALYFGFFDLYSRGFSEVLSETPKAFLAGAATALTASMITSPLDYLKTRRMAGLPWFQGWTPRPYYRGLTLNLARVVPHFSVCTGVMSLIHQICL